MARRAALLVAVLTGCVLLAPHSTAAAPGKALTQRGRWLVDAHGRVVVLHGVNQVSKLEADGYLPSRVGFGDDDAAAIASMGFNTVRTGFHHAGLTPAPGNNSAAYLADLKATVRQLTRRGIHVLIDYHQDMYNERYQGNGMADWATVDSVPGDPTLLPACNLGFPGNMFACPPLWEAYDRFFGLAGRTPEVGPRGKTLQAEFAESWVAVANALKDEPGVFGYDIYNEPHPGSQVLACLNPNGCPPGADTALTAFSRLVTDAIRKVDPKTVVYYEPYGPNFNPGFPTTHGDIGAGPAGFSFHNYACPSSISPVVLPKPITDQCATLGERRVFELANQQADKYDDTLLLTEFGASDDLNTIDRLADLADAAMVGWQYWAWWNADPCCARPAEGIIDDPKNPPTAAHLDQPKLDVLVRPYPRVVAGVPTRWSWDETAKRFELSFSTERIGGGTFTANAETEVWVPRRHFPAGYRVVELSGGRVVSAPGAEALRLRTLPGASSVSLAVVPGTTAPGPGPGGTLGPDPGTGGQGDGGLPGTGALPLTALGALSLLLAGRLVLRRDSR